MNNAPARRPETAAQNEAAHFMKLKLSILTLVVIAAGVSVSRAESVVPNNIQPLLVKFCGECHGAETREADLLFDTLSSL